MFSVSLREARQVSCTYQEKVLPCISPSVLPALRLADSGAPSRKLAKPNPVFATKLDVWFGEKVTAAVRRAISSITDRGAGRGSSLNLASGLRGMLDYLPP